MIQGLCIVLLALSSVLPKEIAPIYTVNVLFYTDFSGEISIDTQYHTRQIKEIFYSLGYNVEIHGVYTVKPLDQIYTTASNFVFIVESNDLYGISTEKYLDSAIEVKYSSHVSYATVREMLLREWKYTEQVYLPHL